MIAVTGANGLLGSFIVRKLIEYNEPFVAFKRKNSDTSLLNDLEGRITWREVDILNPLELDEALEQVTCVIHSAAAVSFNPVRARQITTINVMGTRNIVDACLLRGIKRLVHISSVAALGRQKHQAIVDETNQWINSPFNSVYAESKYRAELEVFRGQEEGLSTVIINPSFILAPADWTKSSARLFKYVWDKKPFYIDGFLNYVDVRDVVDVTYMLMHAPIEGQRFIVNAGNISYKAFLDKIALRFKKRSPWLKLNKTFLQILARTERLRIWLTGSEPLITKETARMAGTTFLYNNERVAKVLRFRFQPIDETIDWCCQSYMTKFKDKN